MDIVRGRFGALTMAQLKPYEDKLRVLFDAVTYERDNSRYYSSKYDRHMVEAKGAIYANDPMFKDKCSFMEREFTRQNNEAFGYDRFEYLYLEDSFPEAERICLTHEKICAFFKER